MPKLNPLERLAASIAPRWGVRRLTSKLALDQAEVALRGFDGARRDRRTAGWQATGGSANAELMPALDTIRRRSRDLIRNNEWAGNAKRKWQGHIIGTGITARPADDESAASKKRCRGQWNAFVENCDPQGLSDFYGLQASAIGEVIEGGAAFLRWHLRPSSWGLQVPLQCEVLEHDHLDVQRVELRDGNVVINGVEYDSFGRRVAYWLFPHHPGDLSAVNRRRFVSERVPASQIDHIFRVDRPGQVTGVPWLAPALLRFRDIADYDAAELVRKKIESCLTLFVTRNGEGPTTLAQASAQSTDPATQKRLEKIAPGLIVYGEEGEDVKSVVPAAIQGYSEYLGWQMLALAAGSGLPYMSLTGDVSKANYSSMREGRIEFWSLLDQIQWLTVVPQLCRPAWRRVMRAAAARGGVTSPDIRAEWTPPRRPWVDPLKDAKSEEVELTLGLESWSDKVSARGFDPDEQIARITAERENLAKAGIKFGTGAASAPPMTDDGEKSDDQPSKA